MQPERYQTEFRTPWNCMRAEEESNRKMFYVKPLEPLAPDGAITYYDNHKDNKKIARKVIAYDRLYDVTPYDPKNRRCDRLRRDLIWDEIYRENNNHKTAVVTSHWYGRPNRIQIDFPEKKFYRSNKIKDNFYRRNDINVSYGLERSCEIN